LEIRRDSHACRVNLGGCHSGGAAVEESTYRLEEELVLPKGGGVGELEGQVVQVMRGDQIHSKVPGQEIQVVF